jgi:hypothetical protein
MGLPVLIGTHTVIHDASHTQKEVGPDEHRPHLGSRLALAVPDKGFDDV